MIEIMTPKAPSICPTALIISQFMTVYSSGDSTNPNAERPTEQTGEGGIRTLGSLLGYGALAKRCFRPLSHLTKSKARISQAILDFQFVISICRHGLGRVLAISSELPIADC